MVDTIKPNATTNATDHTTTRATDDGVDTSCRNRTKEAEQQKTRTTTITTTTTPITPPTKKNNNIHVHSRLAYSTLHFGFLPRSKRPSTAQHSTAQQHQQQPQPQPEASINHHIPSPRRPDQHTAIYRRASTHQLGWK